ncbi:deferrochelatase/peroxidase EfeB [Cytobacillus depressus]|uniref:Deferrochelatase n=1 Tax=Cytobacillus depressus TaxID=1602942 RepID=A0A6L3V2W8_9BACI|nr:iron uptake transporter deferrochelatase/peroxidase subunit [Cytobacillus depressus]KAB2328731.1 deferrochelatase/peroxidase EfeB [Cytobacillus depressus]
MSSEKTSNKYSRRDLLKMSAIAGVGVALGAGGFGAVTAMSDVLAQPSSKENKKINNDVIPFYGEHQAGIDTPQQDYMYIAALHLITDHKQEIIKLFKEWTNLSEALSKGSVKTASSSNDFLPPADTGESEDLTSSNLTITFGLGPTFFMKNGVDRFGIANQKPKYLKDIPLMPRDAIQEPFVEGDICIQVCADNQQVAFHAIRNLMKASNGVAEIAWMQSGFLNKADGKTPRNLFGFKDGTANPDNNDKKSLNEIVWADQDEPGWMKNGTYMAFRKILMTLEIWDRTSLKSQEDTFGRKKMSGAAYGRVNEHDSVDLSQLPANSHVRLAKESGQQIFRRAYSYTDGIDQTTGHMSAGLAFISFQKNPEVQLIPMLKKLSQVDLLNEYTKHIGSAMFAIPGGINQGEYLAKNLLES